MSYDKTRFDKIASDFPILSRTSPSGEPLVFLDSAATALKPQCVIDAVTDMLTNRTSNIHRSVHFLGDEATEAYEDTRDIVAAFVNAEPNEIVFLRNTTEAINLVAKAYCGKGRIISSVAEHHSNYLPWGEGGAGDAFVRLPVNALGKVNLDELEVQLEKGDVALVSLSHISNVTGNVTDIKAIAELVHRHNAKLLVDAAQSAPHIPIDVVDLACDFLAFSGHKLGAPTGVGVLFGKAEILEELDFYLKGGSTIESVGKDGIVAKNAPWKFEAGTPAIESVVGLCAALQYLLELGMDDVNAHFSDLSQHAHKALYSNFAADSILGDPSQESGPYSLNFPGISPHTIARGLSDRYGICIRSGFHCAQPLHEALGVPASLRISFWIYNTKDEISQAVRAVKEMVDVVGNNA